MKKLNRGWVKNAAIIFLLVLVLLTFLSNTIMNRALPEVVTAQPQSTTIVNAVRGTGTAEAVGSYTITVEFSQRILSVNVREGDQVEQGQPLFVLEAAENELLDQLNTLRLQHQKMLLDLSGPNYAMENENIRQAREDLSRAQADRAALGTAEMTEAQAQVRLDEANAAVSRLTSNLSQLELELSYVDTQDARSARIGTYVLAYERALADFLLNVGVSYEDYTGPPNQWSQAVESALADLQTAAANARVSLTGEISTVSGQLTAAQATQTEAENRLTRIQRITAADDRVRAAERALNALIISLAESQHQGNIAYQQRLLDLRELERQIEELEERIRRQQGETGDGEVTILAAHTGVILGLTAVAGQTAQPGIPLARIEVAALGYVAELTVDARQAQQIRPGAAVDVTSLNWFAGITGQVTGVRLDPEDPANRRIVSVELFGEVMAGEQLSLSITINAARFDTVVPRSAVRQDASGAHVFVMNSRSSPLGTRFTAQRVDVTIEAEDERNAAIRGDMDWWFANIIIRSSDTLTDRQAVRLAID
ncbi:MAG: HlyD family efflux transporter periplasmic adaptor subunit [Oscillospiraceae bacterium]|nr:HlyD family efflux transporter periplasmic adaptor subunit [Oscillospiraceae bacterium]